MSGSVRFDRAAEFYDASRAMTPEAMARTIELLASELRGRGRVLEVGVGTGLLALPLSESGLELAGLDLSGPMIDKLVEKAGGRPAFPLVLADATRMPFPDAALGAAYLRWVLHLIPDWRTLIAEVVRVVRPGGRFLANLGGSYSGTHWDIQQRFAEVTGITTVPVGLNWAASDELDAELTSHGATVRVLPPLEESFAQPLEKFIGEIEDNKYSWTWKVSDEVRHRAVAEIRPWAVERFGPLEALQTFSIEMTWRAYDLR